MSTLVGLQESRSAWEPALAKPLDEAVWQAWLAKGRAQDRRSSAARMETLKWVLIIGLLAAVGLWPYLTPYQFAIRFIMAAGAIVVMLQAFYAKHYASAAIFGALALLYNPIAPVITFSSDWQRAVVVTSALPFIALLGWRSVRPARND